MKFARHIVLLAALIGSACTVAPATEAVAQDTSGAVVGQPAPEFTLVDEAGNTHTLSQYRGRIVVLEWTNPECPFIERHYNANTIENIATAYPETVQVLSINSTHDNTAEESQAWKAAQGFAYPTLLDADGTVGHLYGARTTPHMFVIDTEGVLQYAGAIDDDPRGNSDAPNNYVTAAIDALLAGNAPSSTSTTPYGCTVKYE